MIYFATARDINRVKIGYARNPQKRLRQLQTGCPAKLAIECTIDGGYGLETALHQAFRKLHTHGEWFELCPAIEMAIEWVNSGEPIPDDPETFATEWLFKNHFALASRVLDAPSTPRPLCSARYAAGTLSTALE